MTDHTAGFFCPITHELMVNPMIDPEGNSYDKQAIEDWIRQSGSSPITRVALSINDLRPNLNLKTAIDEYRQSTQPKIHSKILSTKEQTSDLTVHGTYANGFVHISVQPPQNEVRSPYDICCVVDTSGSMAGRAEIQNDKNEQYGLTQLDLVKHALKTIINSLQTQDQLSIVSFSSNAKILFRLTEMNEEGKRKALDAVEQLSPCGNTNLWDGLQTGIETLSKNKQSTGSISALFLLTDGCPNVEPSGGHLKALEDLKEKTGFKCSINTFGFGYSLDSKLLEDIAILGNCGSYAFIPDGSFVGTIFVNAISTLLTTVAANVQVLFHEQSLQPSAYTRWYSTHTSNRGTTFDLGSITYGQSKDLLIPLPLEVVDSCTFTVIYDTAREKRRTLGFDAKANSQRADLAVLNRHMFRLQFVHCVRTAVEQLRESGAQWTKQHDEALRKINILQEDMSKYIEKNDEFIKDLSSDLTGQVQQAIERKDWFNKWGVHFLPSLTRAHLLQFCNNFKDPGIQHYGNGTLFSAVRDEMDAIFCGLPAPKRSQTGATIDMTVFHNASGGCFHGGCVVRLMNGTTKLVKDVRPGDQMAPHGGVVTFVIKTKCQNQKAKMVTLENGLIITSWHPIRLHQQWIMPCQLVSSPNEISCETVYNFALDRGHIVLVNDVECVSLGHGFKEDVVRHAYYGSQRVIEDLRELDLKQNNAGFIEISEEILRRSVQTGLVIGVQQQQILVQ